MKYICFIFGIFLSAAAFSQNLKGLAAGIWNTTIPADSVLYDKDIQLREVEIHPGEDRAYGIMRQAIKKAPYYRFIVKEANYEAYTKGSGKMTDIPKLMDKLSKGEADRYKDKLFLQESYSEIQFTAPDRFEQKVLAYSSTFPNRGNPENVLTAGMTSFYNPMFGPIVSPLNPKSFDYYRFRYEGYEEEDNVIINKIRIIPKLKDAKLMEGLLYIADEEWSIRHAELTTWPVGLTARYVLNFQPVIDDIYLITNYELHADMDLLGIKLQADFLSSIQYKNIVVNDSLAAAVKENKQPQKKKSLEIKDVERVKKTVDSLAVNRDSLYWAEVRTVVLNEEEVQSYERKDSIQAYTDSIAKADKDEPSTFHYAGLTGIVTEYNFVDGFHLGQAFELDFKKKQVAGWRIFPSAYWATARKTLIWKIDITLDYSPLRLGQLRVSAGHTSEDFAGNTGMARLANSLYTFLWGYNQVKLYDKCYGQLFHTIELLNGLQLGLGMEYADRRTLNARTDWNLLGVKQEWESNLPDYDGSLNMQYGRLAEYSVHLQYTPEYYYRIHGGKKQYVRSRFPTFDLDYRQGVGFSDEYSAFRALELRVSQQFKLGLFSRFNYTLTAGKYLSGNAFNYIDYKHFTTGNTWLTFKNWQTTYAFLPYYKYATGQEWAQVFVNYNTDYLLLKRLPFLQGKFFTESLQAKFLHTPAKKYYSEWGYSIELPQGLGGAGVFVMLDVFRYNGIGIQLSMPMFGANGGKGNREIRVSIGE